jgi:hypothetical protein
MKMIMLSFLLGGLLTCTGAGAASGGPDPCEYFFAALKAVPNETLWHRAGEFESLWGGQKYRGCEVRFVTNDSLRAGAAVPDFDALPDSEMYRLGWRMSDSIGADGPGSGIFGIEKDTVLCVVRWEQPAYIGDEGEFVQSEILSMTIQCRER